MPIAPSPSTAGLAQMATVFNAATDATGEAVWPSLNGHRAPYAAQMAAEPADDSSTGTQPPGTGEPQSARANDPLAGMTRKQVWHDCVWLSEHHDDTTSAKLMLLCIGRFFDENARSSSMSYAQIARECRFEERSSKRLARTLVGRWLSVTVGGGFYVPGKGRQNLYSGICPPDLVERLREQRRDGKPIMRDDRLERAVNNIVDRIKNGVTSGHPENGDGVTHNHPEPASGVTSGHPEGERGDFGAPSGCPQVTRTPTTPKARQEGGGPKRTKSTTTLTLTKAEIDAAFDEWYGHYPRKTDRLAARDAYAKLLKSGNANIPQLLAAVKAYRFHSDRQFIKHPATWLNKGSWLDVSPASGTTQLDEIEAEVQRLAATEIGRAMIGDRGRRASPAGNSRRRAPPPRGCQMSEAPHNLDFERALLAAIITDNAAIDQLGGFDAESFFDAVHREVFIAMLDLRRSGRAINLATLSGLAGADPLGGASVLDSLKAVEFGNAIPSAHDLAAELSHLALQRSMLAQGAWLSEQALSRHTKASDTLAAHVREIDALIAKARPAGRTMFELRGCDVGGAGGVPGRRKCRPHHDRAG